MSEAVFTERSTCRVCSSPLTSVVDLGMSALTSAFPNFGEEDAPQAPMHLMSCSVCRLLQLKHSVRPQLMYRSGYGYASGVNETMVAHLRRLVDDTARRYGVAQGARVLDIACNDGTLLRAWERHGVERHGVDPIASPVPGCKITRGYFRGSEEQFDVITSIAMLYDVEDPVQFAYDVAKALKPNGVWVVEVGYAAELLEGKWDGICHEHLTYFGLSQLVHVASAAGLYFDRAELNDSNAGSIRCCFTKQHIPGLKRGYGLVNEEAMWDYSTIGPLIGSSSAALAAAVRQFKRVAILGASTKGNTILQTAGLTRDDIICAIDRNPTKRGRVLPGSQIPIILDPLPVSPDAYLVLPYHFRESILARHAKERAAGVKFIFPLPTVEIV